MTISPVRDSERSSSSKSKQLKQKNNTWEIKKRLVKQRLKYLENGESFDTDMPLICYPPKTSSTNVESSSSVGVSASATERAEKVQANLPPQFPSFVKQMLKSHVTGGFWLGLPSKFCLAHLPKYDGTIVLVDENGVGYDIIYLAVKGGLSGGWRGFSIAHGLVEGDVLVFQLIEPCKFEVYIVRAAKLAKVPMIVAKSTNQPEGGEGEGEGEAQDSLELVRMDQLASITNDQARDKSDNSGSQIMDGIRFSNSPPCFKDVKCFSDFNVHVDGLIIDSEIPIHRRTKYYNLCLSQKMFLHQNLVLGLNAKLAAGIISETIKIADAIRIAKPSTDLNNLRSWDKTLKAFEDLGMVVGFLRARIHKLLNLVSRSQSMIERKRSERGEVEGEIRVLEMKLLEMRKRVAGIDKEIDDLEKKNEELDGVFMEVVGTPW